MRAIELRGDARLEDALVLRGGNALAVVEDGEQARVAGSLGGEEDAAGAGVAGVAKKLDDHILARADVLGGLAPFGLGGPGDGRSRLRGRPRPGRRLSPHTSSMKSLRVSPSMAYLA